MSALQHRNRKCSNENEIKKIKVKSKYRHECQHCSCQHSTKIRKIKFLNRKIEIQNEIMENQIEKQNIGMSVDIDIEVTENEIKNKIK